MARVFNQIPASGMRGLHPITPEEVRVLQQPLLETQLPIRFANGSLFNGLQLACMRCKTFYVPERIRARLTRYGPSICRVEMGLVCPSCGIACFGDMRLNDELQALTRDQNGNWIWHEGRREGLMSRALQWIARQMGLGTRPPG